MSTNIDIAANFINNYNESYFHWLEDTIQESLSDEQIIEKFKIYEPFWNEEDIRFIEWALYYFKLIGRRNWFEEFKTEEPESEPESSSDNEDDDDGHTIESDDFDRLLDQFIREQLEG
ncbi:MAG: hypothetical protein J6Q97_01860, partial [Bacteroidaceae bacterium]|nr:hypothetical protein [Bacteroidaceae bacterium]